MSDICVYIDIEDYLAQWFIHEQGGVVPVRLTRGSIESKILELYLQKLPKDAKPVLGKDKLAIAIPSFRHKPPETYNHLPRRATAALLSTIRSRFDVLLFSDLHTFGNIGKRQDELIYAWMEKHEIEPTEKNWNTIAKRYQRQRKAYLARERAKKNFSAKKSS